MNRIFLLTGVLLIGLSTSLFAQCPEITGENLFESNELLIIRDAEYGAEARDSTQVLDLYLPPTANTCKEADLILVIHGGGFEKGDKSQLTQLGNYFARKGFFAAIINYRQFMNSEAEYRYFLQNPFIFFGTDDQCSKLNSIGKDGYYRIDKAWYFAMQDAWTALGGIQLHMEKYQMKINRLFVFGESAGAISALGMAMIQQEEIDALEPRLRESFGPLVNLPATFKSELKKIDAVVSVSGGMLNLESFLSEEDTIPMLFFNGGKDEVIPLCKDACYYMDRRMTGPLRLKELADSLNLITRMETHFWAGADHLMLGKRTAISDIMMNRLVTFNKAETFHNRLMLYPPHALMSNCEIVTLRDQLRSFNNPGEGEGMEQSMIYPNPSDGRITVNVADKFGIAVVVGVYNLKGNLVYSEEKLIFQSELNLDLSHLGSGIYELRISEAEGNLQQARFIIH